MESFVTQHPILFEWLVLPLAIFSARTVDMALGTLRIVFISQGRRVLAPLFGFLEALIWLVVVSQALRHLANPLCIAAYAGGFAAGNLVGLQVEQRLALGMRILRIILRDDAEPLVEALRAADLGVTVVVGEGLHGPVKILFGLVRRRDLPKAIEIVRAHRPTAFFTVEDVRQAAQGYFPSLGTRRWPWSRLSWQLLKK